MSQPEPRRRQKPTWRRIETTAGEEETERGWDHFWKAPLGTQLWESCGVLGVTLRSVGECQEVVHKAEGERSGIRDWGGLPRFGCVGHAGHRTGFTGTVDLMT